MEEIDWQATDFRAWLASMEPTEIVGLSDDFVSCPIARWRRLQYGEVVSVCIETVTFAVDGKVGPAYLTSDWVELFVQGIDERHVSTPPGYDDRESDYEYLNEPVPAAEALMVLDMIAETR